MCTQFQLNEIMKAMVECYRSVYGNQIVDIVLYGSYARGDYTENSDIDIVAVVHGSRMELQQKLKEVWDRSAEVGLENDIVVSPTVIPYDEFKNVKEDLEDYYKKLGIKRPKDFYGYMSDDYIMKLKKQQEGEM